MSPSQNMLLSTETSLKQNSQMKFRNFDDAQNGSTRPSDMMRRRTINGKSNNIEIKSGDSINGQQDNHYAELAKLVYQVGEKDKWSTKQLM